MMGTPFLLSLFIRDKRNGVVRFEWWRECEDLSFFSYTGNTTSLSETRTEPTGNDSAKLSEERLQLFGHDVDDYYTF